MFDHSIKVPRLYKTAAKIAKQVKEELASVKQLVYEKKHPNVKALFALVVEACHRYDELDRLFRISQILVKEPRLDAWLARILITELLWGKKRLSGESKPVKTVLAYEQILKGHLHDPSNQSKVSVVSKVDKPRYVRINTICLSLNEAIDAFRHEGWELSENFNMKDYKGFLQKISTLGESQFMVDIHIPNLLIFPPRTEFHNHSACKSGAILLQDKASCLPVHILAPPPGSIVLDMCSAPGMKTTQVAALLNDEGTVYAVERDERRFEILRKMVEKSGAKCVKVVNNDILKCDSRTFPDVEYILVDPSCSGSGIMDRLEIDNQANQGRLEKLAGFQIKILRHALTKFPSAKRVVYSTCSIMPEENEDVVRQVLETNSNFKLVPAKNYVNNTWHNFGSTDFGEMGEHCLYAKPYDDLTNGFFVAVFERLEEDESNKFFNTRIFNYKKSLEAKKKERQSYEIADTEGMSMKNEFTANHYDESEAGCSHSKFDGMQSNSREETIQKAEIVEQNEFSEVGTKKKQGKAIKCEGIDDITIKSERNDEENVQVTDSEPVKKKKKRKHIENDEPNFDEIDLTGGRIKSEIKHEFGTVDTQYDPDIEVKCEHFPKKEKGSRENVVEVIEIKEEVKHDFEAEKKKRKKKSRFD